MSASSANPKNEFNIQGIDLEEKIGEGAHSIVYRGRDRGKTVAVKVQKRIPASSESTYLMQYRREAATLARINHPGVLKVFSVGEAGNLPYLIMEYFEGQELSRLIADSTLTELEIVELGIQLAEALSALHRFGLVHRDLKPSNVLVGPGGTTKLIDFAFVAETQVADEQAVVGTLLYAPPEQIRVIDFPVDARSDLYSLGAVLYCCATKAPPFQSESVAEICRKHAVESPKPLKDLKMGFSQGLSDILTKLLEKTPVDRYQTTLALVTDLRELRKCLISHRIEDFSLGTDERANIHLEEMPMVGREKEFESLKSQWQKVRRERLGAFVLVEGVSGNGKSRMIRELSREVARSLRDKKEGLVLYAKCAEANPVPFAPIRTLVNAYIQHVGKLDAPEKERIFAKVRSFTRSDLGFWRYFTPQLSKLIADVDGHENGDYSGSQSYLIIAQLLALLTKAVGASLFVIDDIQWIDEASFSVLLALQSELKDVPLLVCCTSRSEPRYQEKLARFNEQMGSQLKQKVSLQPLQKSEVGKFVQWQLGELLVQDSLVDQISMRSGGVPFAVKQYISLMIDGGLIYPKQGEWKINLEAIRNLQIPDSLQSLVLSHIETLSEQTREVLSAAAVIGSEFSTGDLAEILQNAENTVQLALNDAGQAGLIEVQSLSTYVFVHDSVLEALMMGMGEGKARVIHQRVAEMLAKKKSTEADDVYALAQHYYLGQTELSAQEAFTANYKAAEVALQRCANDQAYIFYQQAQAILKKHSIATVLEFEILAGEINTRVARFQVAIEHYEAALGMTTDGLARAEIRYDLADICQMTYDLDRGAEEVVQGLKEIGKPLPSQFVFLFLASLKNLFIGLFIGWTGIGYGSAKGKDRERLKVQAKLLEIGTMVAYFDMDSFRMASLILYSLYPAHRIGESEETTKCYCNLSVVVTDPGFYKFGRYLGKRTLKAAAKLGVPIINGEANMYNAWVHAWTDDTLPQGNELSKKTIREHGKILKQHDLVIMCTDLIFCLVHRGYPKEAIEWSKVLLEASDGATSEFARNNPYIPVVGTAHAMLGQLNEVKPYFDRAEPYMQSCAHGFSCYLQWTHLTNYFVGGGEPFVKSYYEEWSELGLKPILLTFHARSIHLTRAYIELTRCLRENSEQNRKSLTDSVKMVRKTIRVGLIKGHWYVLEAGLCLLQDQTKKALEYLDMAEQMAGLLDAPWVLMETYRMRAHCALRAKNVMAARALLSSAMNLAHEQGMEPWAGNIKKEFESSGLSSFSEHASSLKGETGAASGLVEYKAAKLKDHLNTLVNVSAAHADLFQPEQSIRNILSRVCRAFNAERAALLLAINGRDELEFVGGMRDDGTGFDSLKGYSSTLVHRVAMERKAKYVSANEEGEVSLSESAAVFGLKSIVVAPMLLGEELKGVLYLDNTLSRGLFAEEDLVVVSAVANQIAMILETAKMAQAGAAQIEMEKDLQVAAAVQMLLMPKSNEVQVGDVSIAASYRSATRTGGDWWSFEDSDPRRVRVLVGDATGHGAGAAMITAVIAGCHHAISQQTNVDTESMLKAVNETVSALADGSYAMTVAVLEFDRESERAILYSAAAPMIFQHVPGEDKARAIQGDASAPIGYPSFSVSKVEFDFVRGSRLMIFTDGVNEMRIGGERQLGFRRLKSLFESSGGSTAGECRDQCLVKLDELRKDFPLDDDQTFLILQR